MKHIQAKRWFITLAACLLVFACLAVFKVMQIRAAIEMAESFPEPSETVEAEAAKVQNIQPRVSTLGEIIAPEMVELRNELEGRIDAVGFVAGTLVKKGQILIQLDISEETARLKAARASADLARIDLQRIEKLRQSQTVSQERLDQAKAQYDIATAETRAQQAIINKKTLRAPFDAYTGLHTFEVGELLERNTLITTLVGITELTWVDFSLPQQHIGITVGTDVNVELIDQSSVSDSLLLPKTLVARIIARDSVISDRSRNLRFRAKLQLPQQIPPNTVVNVTVPVGQSHQQVTVPTTAVNHDGLGDYVYVLEADTEKQAYRAIRRTVTLGTRIFKHGQRRTAIDSGLQEGELIASRGAFKLREGLLTFIGPSASDPSSGAAEQMASE